MNEEIVYLISPTNPTRNTAPPPRKRCLDNHLRFKVKQRTPNSVFCSICDSFLSKKGTYSKGTGVRCLCCKEKVRWKSKRNRMYGK